MIDLKLRPIEPAIGNRINKYPIHWSSKMLMPLPDDIFTSLLSDIKSEGQLEPVLLWTHPKTKEEFIVDGNHRQQVMNIIGKKLKTIHLPKTVKEEDLPFKVLGKQFNGRGGDKLYCCCEAVDAIEVLKKAGIKTTAVSLVKRYPAHLNKITISYLSTIKRLRNPWFMSLKHGIKVDTGLGYRSNNTRALAKMCKDEEKNATIPIVESSAEGDFTNGLDLANKILGPCIQAAIAASSLEDTKAALSEYVFKL